MKPNQEIPEIPEAVARIAKAIKADVDGMEDRLKTALVQHYQQLNEAYHQRDLLAKQADIVEQTIQALRQAIMTIENLLKPKGNPSKLSEGGQSDAK